jgi:transcriptional regulator with XRE-family HTH domain
VANLLGPKHVAQLGAYIREQRENAQYSLRQLAQAAGVSNPYLSQIERGLRKPSAEILQQLAKALEISAETLYVRAGLLDGADGVHGDGSSYGSGSAASSSASAGGSAQVNRVIAAIGDDPALTRRQKQILREIYESFRAESAAAATTATATATTTASASAAPAGGDEASTDTGLDAPHETRGD